MTSSTPRTSPIRSPRAGALRAALALTATAFAVLVGFASTAGAAPTEEGTDPLAAWQAALASASSEPADILFLGDSVSQGYGAPTRAEWFLETVRQQLQTTWGGTGRGYRAAWSTFWPADDAAWSLSGGRSDETVGLGLRAHLLDSASASLSVKVEGESFRLLYATAPGRGAMEISVDGAVVATVDTAATTPATGQAWASGPLGAGPHTVLVRVASSGKPWVSPVLVEGILDGDTPSGVRMWDASHGGYSSTHYALQRGWEGSLAQADPELVVIELGGNDYVFQLTAAEFEANIRAIVAGVRASATGPVSIALLPIYNAEGRDPARYTSYVEAERRIAAEEGLAMIDLSATDASLLTDDGIHPHALGQRVFATSVLAAVDPAFDEPLVPAAPTDLVVEAGTGTVTASWTADPAADTYVVRLLDAAGTVVSERTQTSATATFTGLREGAAHTVVVFAGGPAGFSSSSMATATTAGTLVVAPSDPTDVVATHDPATGAVHVTWTAPAGPVTDYTVISYDAISGAVTSQVVSGTSATFDLTAGRSYIFGVHAHNSAGYSPGAASNVVAVPVKVVAPTAPTSAVATHDATTGAVVVTWKAPAGTVSDYLVQAYDTVSGYVSAQVVTGTSASFTLPAGRSYVFAVYARNSAGYSPAASTNTVAVPAKATPPAAPTNVVATTTSAKGTVQVRWTAPAGPVTSYTVVARDTASGQLITKTVTTTNITFTGLKAGRTYVFTVQARNTVGTSPVATSSSVKVLR